MNVEDLPSQNMKAALMMLDFAGIEPTQENVKRYLEWEILSFTEDANGHYCWYLDEDGNEACIKVETLEEISVEEYD